ncbi:hypothetical protein ASPFODRAFT_480813 [Aspergillus luchuensis CBS 106.47]|uniref:Uncharacterized protein n=1 Tax=Aspergillus luchuensis (strain CBS 106.47) TaxID=1137211 RepID=A0A1M3TR29_ASPLC|nr:hypothetical protein ASPFODRAFT_480813 [Aspergillus luchuensis CBS 106.47]
MDDVDGSRSVRWAEVCLISSDCIVQAGRSDGKRWLVTWDLRQRILVDKSSQSSHTHNKFHAFLSTKIFCLFLLLFFFFSVLQFTYVSFSFRVWCLRR